MARVPAHDYDGFAEHELAWREALAWPPFSRLVAVRIEGEDPGETAAVARKLGDRVAVLLPGPATGRAAARAGPGAACRGCGGRAAGSCCSRRPGTPCSGRCSTSWSGTSRCCPAAVRVVLDVDPGAML